MESKEGTRKEEWKARLAAWREAEPERSAQTARWILVYEKAMDTVRQEKCSHGYPERESCPQCWSLVASAGRQVGASRFGFQREALFGQEWEGPEYIEWLKSMRKEELDHLRSDLWHPAPLEWRVRDNFIIAQVNHELALLEGDGTTVEQPGERLVWKSTTSALAFIFNELVAKRYIELPAGKGKDGEVNYAAYARALLRAFKVHGKETTPEQLRVRLSPSAPNPLPDHKIAKFTIPDASEMS